MHPYEWVVFVIPAVGLAAFGIGSWLTLRRRD